MAQAGTAYIPFQGQFDDLLRDARRYGQRAADELRAGLNGANIGRDAGNDIGRGLNGGLDDLRRAGARAGDQFGDGFNSQAQRSVKSGASKIVGVAAGAFAGMQVASIFGDMLSEAREAAQIARLTEQVIESTGGAANLAAEDISALSEALSKKAGVDDEAIQSGANLLLTFTKVRDEVGAGNDIFSQATELALDMSVAMGTEMRGAAMQLGKALNDPIKGMSTLGRAGVQFSEQQKEQIRTLVESGDVLSAQKIILGELETRFGGAAEAASDPIQKLGVMWGNFLEGVGAKILPWAEDISSWIGERLPGAMGRAGDVIGDLRDRAVEFGTVLWDRVGPAAEDLWDALQNIGEFAADAWDAAQPLVEGLAVLGGAAIIASFTAVADALESVTGFLADHTDLVLAAAAAWAAYMLTVKGAAVWTALSGAISGVTGSVSALIAGIQGLAATRGVSTFTASVEVARSSVAGLAAGMTSVTIAAAGLAAVAAAGFLVYSSFNKAQQATEAWREELDSGIDTASFQSYQNALDEVVAKSERASQYLEDIDAKGAGFFGQLKAAQVGVIQTFTPLEDTLAQSISDVNGAEQAAKEYAAAIVDLKSDIQGVSDELNISSASAEAWIQALDLDPAAMSASDLADAVDDARRMAESGSPAVDALATSFETLGDETASASDELTAWKDALDAIMGVQINFEQAQIGLAEHIHDLANAQRDALFAGEEWSTNLFGGDSASLETRNQIAGLAEEAINAAGAFFEAGGSMEDSTDKLREYREGIIRAGEQAGISREDMEAYLDTLNLTPDNLTTIIRAHTDEPSISAADLALEVAARNRRSEVGAGMDWDSVHAADRHLAYLARDRKVRLSVEAIVSFMDETGAGSADAAERILGNDRSAGPKAVMPKAGIDQKAWYKPSVVPKIAPVVVPVAGDGPAVVHATIDIDGETFARVVTPAVSKRQGHDAGRYR